jgi:plastocyanin
MRTRLLTLLPALALTACLAACGGDETGIPTGSWHHGSTGSGTGGGSSTGGSNGATGSSTGGSSSTSSGGSGNGGSTSSGGSSSSSGGSTASSGSGGGSSSGTNQPPPNLGVTLDQMALSVQLLATADVHVSIAPNGYSGTVDLAAGTLPSGVTAGFDKPTLTLDGATPGTATLTITTATSAPPGTVPLAINATAGGATASAAVSVTVQSVITLHIPQGVNNTGATVNNPNSTAFGPYPIAIAAPAGLSSSNPVTVYFKNDDTVSHEIHADAQGQGFGHDPGSIGAGQMDPYVRKVNTAGTYDFYLHDQGNPLTIGRIFIQAGQ